MGDVIKEIDMQAAQLETDLRVAVLHIDYVKERLNCFKNLLMVDNIEPLTEINQARDALGKIIMTLSNKRSELTAHQKTLLTDALELVESAETHIRWLREELGNAEPCTAETDTKFVLKLLRKLKYKD